MASAQCQLVAQTHTCSRVFCKWLQYGSSVLSSQVVIWVLAHVATQLCAGVPHAQDCDVCMECLRTELPQVRFDFKSWGAADAQQRLRRRTSPSPDAARENERTLLGLAALQDRNSSDMLSQPLWEWGDFMYATAAQATLEHSLAEVCMHS